MMKIRVPLLSAAVAFSLVMLCSAGPKEDYLSIHVPLPSGTHELNWWHGEDVHQVTSRFFSSLGTEPEPQVYEEVLKSVRKATNRRGVDKYFDDTSVAFLPKTPGLGRNVFLDLGSRTGEMVYGFFMRLSDFEWYMWECNPRMKPILDNFMHSVQDYGNVTFMNKAAWIEDGEMSFYIDDDPSAFDHGSSLFDDHALVHADQHKVTVESVDFSSWIKRNFNMNDHIVMRMDIEGAEYPILQKMIDDGTICYIDYLDIEWHAGFSPTLKKYKPEETRIPAILEQCGATVTATHHDYIIDCAPDPVTGKEVCRENAEWIAKWKQYAA